MTERVAIVPRPAATTATDGATTIVTTGGRVAAPSAWRSVAQRFVESVSADCGIELRVVDDDPLVEIRSVAADRMPAADVLGISPTGAEPADERSVVEIADGRIVVSATSTAGAFRGLTSVRQLISASCADGRAELPALRIDDAPRFAWRGLSLDVVRTFIPVEGIEQIVELLALYKLNVLHLHLTDDQAWRLQIPGLPALTDIGGAGALADRPGGWYSTEQFRALTDFAADRFVTIVPEVDMPGHARAAITAIPALAPRTEGGDPVPPGNLLLASHPGVMEFASTVVDALVAQTAGPFVHIGGDEAFGIGDADFGSFVDGVRAMVLAAGKRPIGWQETARSSVGPDDIVQHWLAFGPEIASLLAAGDLSKVELPPELTVPREMLDVLLDFVRRGDGDLARAIECGARILLSPGSHLYFDRPFAEPPADPAQRERRDRLGLRLYRPMTLEQSFDWDPLHLIDAPPEQLAGVEAAIWCETLPTVDDVMFMLVPRLPGAAERAWSSATSWSDYRERLAAQAVTWRRRGWSFFESSLVPW